MGTADEWPFVEARDKLAFTTKRIVQGGPVLAIHHEPDGVWQFLDDGPLQSTDGVPAHLGHFVDRHPWVVDFADLPRGWMAWRNEVDGEWYRQHVPAETNG